MKILSIETSCDETAVSIIEATGDFPSATYKVLGDALWSQIDIHREYGGVFPALAKREHAKTLVKMLEKAGSEAACLKDSPTSISPELESEVRSILDREPGLADDLLTFYKKHGSLDIDLIAVTHGPGLEPALWVGVNFAKALAMLWNTPVVPVNHMEGHILSSVFDGEKLAPLQFPALSLLVSGGHTEIIKFTDWNSYEKIGETRDDAVGEAFDKVARLLGLPYPGGPEISKLAKEARENAWQSDKKLPRPMLDSGDLDFSFSGLKTAVRYAIGEAELSHEDKAKMAREFEDAATEVLLKKAIHAVALHGAKSLILGGGVTANSFIRESFTEFFAREYPDLELYLPERTLSTDNSIMIALSGHARMNEALENQSEINAIRANGNRSLAGE